MPLDNVDPEIAKIIESETRRQNDNIQLIASENHVSAAVRQAVASVLTNKYAEGYPGKRYYGGCEFVDQAENLAIERAKKLFGAEHVNVQLHSGSQANMAVYFSVLDPGDTILGMELNSGGHLTHGAKVSFSGKIFKAESYAVSQENEQIDYSEVSAIAKKAKPKLIVCGASAYPRTIDFKAFRDVADEVDAYLMADIAHIAGLIAAGAHPSPVKHVDFVTTTTHKTLRGPRGAMILCKAEHAKAIDRTVFPGIQGGPFMNSIAGKAVCFKEAATTQWKKYQVQIVKNSKAVAKRLLDDKFTLVSGGTDNHLLLVNVKADGITGRDAEDALAASNITLNKNTIPFETESPFVTSGIRIGTPCVTTRGMGEAEMVKIASMISDVLKKIDDDNVKKDVRQRVSDLTSDFPLYPVQ